MNDIPEKAQSYVQAWCELQDWSEPFVADGQIYAFPPDSVVPQVIPGASLLLRDDCFPSEPKFTPEQAEINNRRIAIGRKPNAAIYQSPQSMSSLLDELDLD
jgi:hypothetical protein